MSTAIDLGTISASVALDLSRLSADRAQVSAELSGIGSALDRLATQSEIDGKRIAAAAFSREEQAALKKQEAALKAQAASAQVLRTATINSFTGIAAGITLAGIAAVKMSADFESSMTKISNNTTMTAADIVHMKQTVVALGKESGASFDQLGEGFMHIVNFGFKAADATVILREAMKSAVATGSSTADTADILAKSLHEFGLGAGDASKAMNVMHLAAAQGNMTLQQFDQAAGPAFAQAANLGVGLTDVSAAMSALTRHGLDASEAATQVKDILVHLINPSKSAREELEKLSEKTGINLVADFSQAGLKAKGLTGVLDDLRRATNGNGQEIYKLIQAQRGGLGAMILAGTGAKDYKDILSSLTDAMTGKVDPATQGYQKSLHTLNNEIARVTNEIKADFLPVGEKLTPLFEAAIPVIHDSAVVLGEVLDVFGQLPRPIQEGILAVGAFRLGAIGVNMVLGTLGGKLPSLVGGLGKLTGAFTAVTGAETAAAAEGAGAFAAGGAWVLGIGAAIALVWSLKGAWDHVSGAQAQALHNKVWQEIAQGHTGSAGGNPTVQYVKNEAEAKRIQSSPQYTGAIEQIPKLKQAVADIKAKGVQAYQKPTSPDVYLSPGQMQATALNEYNAALKTAQKNLADTIAYKKKMDADAHALRADARKMAPDAVASGSRTEPGIDRWNSIIDQVSKEKGLAPDIIKAIIHNESGGNPLATNHNHNGTTDYGIMQVNSATKNPNSYNWKDPYQNMLAGVTEFQGKLAAAHGDLRQGFRRYNGAGPMAEKYADKATAYLDEIRTGGSGRVRGAGGKTPAAARYQPPVDPNAVKDRQTLLRDIQDQRYEATHGQFANRRHEALRDMEKADVDPAATPASRAEAKQLNLAKVTEINRDEKKEQKSHYAELLRLWREHLADVAKAQKEDLQRRLGIKEEAAKNKQLLGNLSADMTGNTAALTEDPETYQFARQREEAAKRLRERQEAIGKNQTLGPYGKNDIDPSALQKQAQGEYDAAIKHIQAEEDAKATREAQAAADKSQREKDKADRAIEESARAAEKQRRDIEDTARFEYEQGMISLTQYQAFLRAKLAATAQWADSSHTILNRDWMAAKADYDASLGEKKQKPGQNPMDFLSGGMIEGAGRSLENVLDGGKGKLHGLKAEIKDWEESTIKAIKHVAVMWAMSSLFGSKFGGGMNFGSNLFGGKPKADPAGTAASLLPALTTAFGKKVPTVQFNGGTKPHGLAALSSLLPAGNLLNTALPDLLGNVHGINRIHGINGPFGGSKMDAMGIASLAASFIPGGAAIASLLPLFGSGGLSAGGALSKLFTGGLVGGTLKKLFHFADGGLVPGHGFGDTVPAMLTPGERVLTKDQQRGMSGAPSIIINHHGDNHNAGDVDQMHSDWAFGISQQLATATAGN